MAKLNNIHKQEISEALRTYVGRYPSQNKAVNSLKGVSAATVSCVLNGKWELISDDMWLKIQSQLRSNKGWQLYDTVAHQSLMLYLKDSQEESNVVWITGPAGIGKSTAAQKYAEGHRDVFLLTCSSDMTKADFIAELASKIGIRTAGMTVRETLKAIIRELVKKESPLLIFDEGDKLADSVLYYYVSLYNALEDKCGMVFLSTNYMEERMRRGVIRGRKGYDELESRICRRFVPLDLVTAAEVEGICRANGLEDSAAIRTVLSEAHSCGNDLRRVKKSIHKELRKMAVQSA
ncbi:MAG: AAA family ATPase [Candidatus Cryptobacteroides sp.]